jgi:hypothetical protein
VATQITVNIRRTRSMSQRLPTRLSKEREDTLGLGDSLPGAASGRPEELGVRPMGIPLINFYKNRL